MVSPSKKASSKSSRPVDLGQWDDFADIYDEESISPFRRGVRFPFSADVQRAIQPWRTDGTLDSRVGIDFGCGPGDSLRVLAGRIGLAIGVDFSKRMLDVCRTRLRIRARPRRAHEWIERGFAPRSTVTSIEDLRDLSALRGSVDLATSVNAICPADPSTATLMLSQILRAVAPGGTALVVAPAAESTQDLFEWAEEDGEDLSGLGRFDARRSILTYSTGETQRYLRRREIEAAARGIRGLDLVRLEKIEYPWTHMRDAGWGSLRGRPRLYDWYGVWRRAAKG